MLAYTYIEKGKFDLVEKAKLMLIEATDEEFIFPDATHYGKCEIYLLYSGGLCEMYTSKV